LRDLNPGRMKSGPMPVVLDPARGGSLVGHLLGAMSVRPHCGGAPVS
jgi:PmbA protein